jgi:hypothetical protein
MSPRFSASFARAVGHDDKPFPPHVISGFCRTENSCRNAVAQSFQWRDEGFKLSVDIPRHVFPEETIRPAFINDSDNMIGKESVIIGTAPVSGN